MGDATAIKIFSRATTVDQWPAVCYLPHLLYLSMLNTPVGELALTGSK